MPDTTDAARLLSSLRKRKGGPTKRVQHDPALKHCRCYECRKARGDARKPSL
jgi:hypothetical protein